MSKVVVDISGLLDNGELGWVRKTIREGIKISGCELVHVHVHPEPSFSTHIEDKSVKHAERREAIHKAMVDQEPIQCTCRITVINGVGGEIQTIKSVVEVAIREHTLKARLEPISVITFAVDGY